MKASNVDGIAIIGLAGRFPGAASLDEFWRNLVAGRESISTFSREDLAASGLDAAALSQNPAYVAARGILQDAEWFDAAFFDITPKQAEITDPQQRLFLETSWEALEAAGYSPENFPGLIGVFAGMAGETYFLNNLQHQRELIDLVGARAINLGNSRDYLAPWVAYKLNLRGPALNINTACSTGLVVVCQACQSLLNYQCDLALAGSVAVSFPQRRGSHYQAGGIMSPDGHCRPFDLRAQGTVHSEGLGVVVLKRLSEALEDGDEVLAVITGFGLNNDGSAKVGFTAPSVEGQAEAITLAQADAGVEPSSISYVECHGTATPIGDPIEIAALTQVFRRQTAAKNFCAIGSVKGNIGHADTAAGVAGLIKTTLALKSKLLPPSLHYTAPNPKIDFADSPFFVNAALREWINVPLPRRAGVSSFGLGGTNAHVVLEEAPAVPATGPSRPWQLLLVSAKTLPALEAATANLVAHLKANPDLNLADAAYTLQVGRGSFQHRRMLVCREVADAVTALDPVDLKRVITQRGEAKARPIVFLFPGQGAQYVNMGAELYRREPGFQKTVDRCAEILAPHLGLDLRQVLFPSADGVAAAEELLIQTRLTQPALFVFEYALAKLWESWGIMPSAMIGHSLGEIVAACLAGVFTLEDALAFVARRSQLVQAQPAGAMLAVRLPEQELQARLPGEVSIAAVNAAALSVAAGPFGAIELLETQLKEQGVPARRLPTSHAFHSAMMDPVLKPLAQFLGGLRLHKPSLPFVSNVTGRWITAQEAVDVDYWVGHVRCPVRFAAGLTEVYQSAARQILLEAGPGQTLAPLASQHPAKGAGHLVLSSFAATKGQEQASVLGALGRLWLDGQPVNWEGFYQPEKRRRVSLPTYPFQRERHWVEPKPADTSPASTAGAGARRQDMADWFYVPSWRRSARNAVAAPEANPQNWLLFVDEGGLGAELAQVLSLGREQVVQVGAGPGYLKLSESSFVINPARVEDYALLISSLAAGGKLPRRIVHLWTLDHSTRPRRDPARLEWLQDVGLHSLIFLSKALGGLPGSPELDVSVITNGLYSVTGGESLCPEQATVLGACKVIPVEYPNIRCRNIDLDLSAVVGRRQELAGQLARELAIGQEERVVAYRKGYRWLETFEPVRLESSPPASSRLKARGVYLITGGLGGVGLVLAEFLANSVQARLILVGRSPLPTPLQNAAPGPGGNGGSVPPREKIEAMKRAGAEVLVVAADVAEEEPMRDVIALAEEKFGTINGVIHAAGTIDQGGVVQRRSKEATERVLSAKVKGTLVLDKLFEAKPLDFFLLCSSIATADPGGMLGQVGYVAANEFLDAFAFSKQGRGPGFTVAVNWDAWRDVGMAARAMETKPDHPRAASRRLTSENSLGAEDGAKVFNLILDCQFPRIVVSVVNLEARKAASRARARQTLSGPPACGDAIAARPARPQSREALAGPASGVERTLADIWQQLLGFREVGLDDNFFDLGGDSLLLLQLQAKIKQGFGVELTPAEMFEYTTVRALARRLNQGAPAASGLGTVMDRGQMQRAAFMRPPKPSEPV